jgi:signal peptidase II
MPFLWMSLFAAGIVAVDQFTKFVVLENIALYEKVPFLPGFLGFTYVRNTGGAWSMFSGMMWLFVLVFAVLTVLIFVEYFWKRMPFTNFERWCIAAIYGGGLGNIIDRVRLGYVVDMIETEFITFPVFNVADCFITCGSIAMIVSLLFINKAFWKDEKK